MRTTHDITITNIDELFQCLSDWDEKNTNSVALLFLDKGHVAEMLQNLPSNYTNNSVLQKISTDKNTIWYSSKVNTEAVVYKYLGIHISFLCYQNGLEFKTNAKLRMLLRDNPNDEYYVVQI